LGINERIEDMNTKMGSNKKLEIRTKKRDGD